MFTTVITITNNLWITFNVILFLYTIFKVIFKLTLFCFFFLKRSTKSKQTKKLYNVYKYVVEYGIVMISLNIFLGSYCLFTSYYFYIFIFFKNFKLFPFNCWANRQQISKSLTFFLYFFKCLFFVRNKIIKIWNLRLVTKRLLLYFVCLTVVFILMDDLTILFS